MKLSDCELTHRHIRGHNVSFLFGERAISADEASALAAEFTEVYGPVPLPGYASPAGWQSLDAAPVAEPVAAATPAAKSTRRKAG